MIKRMSLIFTNMTKNYLPDAYVFALILTFVTFLSGCIFMGKTPVEMAIFWGDGLSLLFSFAMQMALILVFGFTLAKTYVVHNLLNKIASVCKSQVHASLMLTFVSALACYINWGFGLIVSALLAVQIARKLKEVNYGLLIANAYSGFLVWHGGLSGSIPLKLTNPDDSIKAILGKSKVALAETIYSGFNLTILFTTLVVLLLINGLMAKFSKEKQTIEFSEINFNLDKPTSQNFAQRLENSRILNFTLVTLGMLYLFTQISTSGMNLNTMIFLFMILGMIFHGTSKYFLDSFNDSVKDCSGILLQFPFYAGIMAMMSGSGLAQAMSEFFVSISSENTFLFFTYLSAGVVNFFVPSGGGQWALQAPIILPAARSLGVDLTNASMSIAWGDAWTNMVQPFWAIPILSAAKCDLKQMMTYSVLVFIFIGLATSLILLLY